ncbi:alpha-amylase family glycosyl hydrolase [Puniceicoccus vermicola]|uniref:Glycoside hydrolase family 1 n=1 Tax=Puniceicoccus vermicola TaxID=388746 RepID=A0A7X1E4Y6_9BACT|nr:alpha-amylase family glycosyl hydrolase [Puniceicoccus vermicola]MBC2603050.1 glycoside hydrolase family 1 [Puniceicoccus vermicola]
MRPFQSLERTDPLLYGQMAGYIRFRKKLLFTFELPERGLSELAEKGVYVAGSFNDWNPLEEGKQWRLQRTRLNGIEIAALRIPEDKIDISQTFTFKFQAGDGAWLDVSQSAPNAVFDENGACNLEFHPDRTGQHIFTFAVGENYETDGQEQVIWSSEEGEEIRHLPPTHTFLELHSDAELGALPSRKGTTFRIFAPRANRVVVEFQQDPSMSNPEKLELAGPTDGIWEGSVGRNLEKWFYHYRVHGESPDTSTRFNPDMAILDPYAKAAYSRSGPGIILGDSFFPKGGVDPGFTPPRWDDLVICECHLRDLLARVPDPMKEEDRLGYSGLAKWVRSGHSYLHELGINAVELQPIQEFDSQSKEEYHWGYMPVNYFSPESTYAKHPEKASQVEEFRDLVRAMHEQEFTVILDVVYNHIGEPNNLLFLDKYYYFHLNTHHYLMNWSGCGNDLRTDAPMVRRIIIESLIHLVEQYGVDGFRFDLADLVGKPTLMAIEAALKERFPHLILISEPWSFRGHLADALKDTGWASWNDGYRDFLSEYVRGTSNRDAACYFLAGSPHSRTEWPAQTVNYSESHDDYCWLDRITENPDHEGWSPTPSDRRRTHLMAAFLFASLGIPMISAGQDALRTKGGIHNTYQRGDLNAIDYERRTYYSGTANYFAQWTRLRLSPVGRLLRPGKHRDNYLSFSGPENSSAIACLYNADQADGEDQMLFAINPHLEPAMIPLPHRSPAHEWIQIADQERVNRGGLEGALHRINANGIYLPALSCGLWRT